MKEGVPDILHITKILADKSRLEILTILMDGRFHTVHEIAQLIKVKDHTTSYHLKKLEENKWVQNYKQGRHVYYRLINPQIAELLENLMNISPKIKINSFNKNKEYNELKHGRSCYCHLAGEIAVEFFDYLLQMEYLLLTKDQVRLTAGGVCFFNSIHVDVTQAQKSKGYFVKPCLDWTERKLHLGGSLGKAFFNMCIERNLITQNVNNRGVTVTKVGEEFFNKFKFDSTFYEKR
jgi:DNA-binding transcriptional ArsR family regulator